MCEFKTMDHGPDQGPQRTVDCMREDCKTSSAHGSVATNGTGGPPSPSPTRVHLTLDSRPSADGADATAWVANGHSTYALVSEDPWGDGFIFTLSLAGLTRDQLVLIAGALGMTGHEVESHFECAEIEAGHEAASVVRLSSHLSARVVRLSIAPSMPAKAP